jgi:hypothetical protein
MMAENDDVQLVESIGGIDGTPLTSDVQNVHMHGSVGANFIVIASNPIVVIVVSKIFKFYCYCYYCFRFC